jgi:4-hydroxy-2-oxoheptanedioate aldolase
MTYGPAAASSLAHGVIRRLFDSGRVTHGGWCMLGNPFAAEIVSASGCDWLAIDQQHGYVSDEVMRVMIQAAGIRGMPVLVRVPWNEPISIGHALDAGAEGVIVPMVSNAGDARRASEASHYPPLGYRSWGPLRAGMAQPGFDALAGNAQVICIAMMETAEGVENLEEIIAVPGLDGVLIGPNDLAISHSGTTAGAATSGRDLELIERVARICGAARVPAGIVCASGEDARRWESLGFTFLALPSDIQLLDAGMKLELAAARSHDRGA